MRTEPQAAIVGIGSVLMGDDAIGPHFVRCFDAVWEVPDDVSIRDLGTPGPELSSYLLDLNHLLVIDAIRTEGQPGDLRVYRKHEILDHDLSIGRSAHDPSLHSALHAAELSGRGPREVTLVGLIPARIEFHAGLSRIAQASMAKIERAVLDELATWGIEPRRRMEPRSPDLWWLSQETTKVCSGG